MSVAVPHTAFVLAAGLGTRMRPLTLTRPKPLIEVGGKALMDHILDPLIASGVQRIIVNVHYFADDIEGHVLARGDAEIIISDERGEVLETGGALAKARPLLGDDPIFVVNTDAFWAPESPEPFWALANAFDPHTEDERLLIADTRRSLGFDGAGDFFLAEDDGLTRRGTAPSAPYAYCGARILNPAVYDNCAVERFSATRLWDAQIKLRRLKGLLLDAFWLHVGDPEALRAAEAWLAEHGA